MNLDMTAFFLIYKNRCVNVTFTKTYIVFNKN